MKRSPMKRGKPLQAKKRMRQRSPKREAYLKSDDRQAGLARMGKVARCGCLVCGAMPVEVHHLPDPRDDMRTVPLCPHHHRTEYGPQAYHFSRRNFNDLHGSDDELLARADKLISQLFD